MTRINEQFDQNKFLFNFFSKFLVDRVSFSIRHNRQMPKAAEFLHILGGRQF